MPSQSTSKQSIQELNALRRSAVQLRLDGHTLAEECDQADDSPIYLLLMLPGKALVPWLCRAPQGVDMADEAQVRAAVEQNGSALQYASEPLKGDMETVRIAVAQYGYALQYASVGVFMNYVIIEALCPVSQ